MIDNIKQHWREILLAIKEDQDMSDVSYKTWLVPLEPVSAEGGILTLRYSDNAGLSYIEKKYKFLIQTAVEVIAGYKCEIRFITEDDEPKPAVRPVSRNQTPVTHNLNPRYTFDNFVVGSNNKLAHAASLAVAESPAEIYNPLFIYGGVGLGKTHLMHSIAHFILGNNPSMKVLYVSSENFMNELIDAIRTNNNSEFRDKYRHVDVLLIDDIQFIANKAGTQEEVFHTFNALYEAKKQIVFSSDRPPKEIEDLEERLLSRFLSGLTVDIGSPDYETRMAILRKKEEIEGFNIDNEVIKYIATNIKSNIRELEGALTKIVAYSRLNNKEITLELAEEALKDNISHDKDREITPERILEIVADHFNLRVSDIASEKRNKEIAYPRQIAMYLCCSMTPASLSVIGKCLGKKDHTTVIHGRDKISRELEESESLRNTVEILRKKLSPSG